jgi:rubrerythrin
VVSKKELLKMLHEAISFEEHIFVLDYTRYLEFLEDEDVRELLKKLIADSRFHALALGEIIAKVEERDNAEW